MDIHTFFYRILKSMSVTVGTPIMVDDQTRPGMPSTPRLILTAFELRALKVEGNKLDKKGEDRGELKVEDYLVWHRFFSPIFCVNVSLPGSSRTFSSYC